MNVVEKLKSRAYKYGWKVIAGVAAEVVVVLSYYFDVIPKDAAVVFGSLSAAFIAVGARAAVGKVIEAVADLIQALDAKK